MLLVRQTGLHDCGVAVAAMIGRVSHEMVLDRLITGLSAERPLSDLVMWRTLEDITQVEWRVIESRRPWPRVRDYPFTDSPAAVLFERTCRSRHYIAVLDGWMYDPLFERPFLQTEYPDATSSVVTVFTPKAGERRTDRWT
jgi:hypothetical protein